MGLNSPWRRKLSVRIHGSKHPLGAEESTVEEISAVTELSSEGGEAEKQVALSPVPQVPGEVIVIEDPSTFQGTRPLFPYRPTTSPAVTAI